ncbi:MAG: hypothetical protein NZ890_12245 [Myxococcota bacterium]|nr:hypothetical protein [Myxococcota bacterium]
MPRLPLSPLMLVGVLAGVGAARAQDRADTTALRAQAQLLREAGDRLYRARNYAGALAQYRRAYEIYRSPMLLVSIAAATEMVLQPVDAALALLQFFVEPGDSPPVVHRTAERNLSRILAALPPERLATLHREVRARFPAEAWDRFPQVAREALPRPEPQPANPPPPRAPGEPPAAAQAAKPASAPPRVPPTPAPLTEVPPHTSGGGLTVAKWVLGTLGLVGAAAGAALLFLDGHCTQSFVADGMQLCKEELRTRDGAIAALVAGGVGFGTSIVLFAVDYRRQLSGAQTAMLMASGRF